MVNFQLKLKKLPELPLDKERCLCETPVNAASQIFGWFLTIFSAIYLTMTLLLGYRATHSRSMQTESIYITVHSISIVIAALMLIGIKRAQPKLFLPFISGLLFVILVVHTILVIVISMVSALFHSVTEKRAIDEYNLTVYLNVYDNIFYFSSYPFLSTIVYLVIETAIVMLQGYMTSVVYRAYKLLDNNRELPSHYVNPSVSSLNPDEMESEEQKV